MPINFTKPVTTDAYATLLQGLVDAHVALARLLDPSAAGTITSPPTGAYRLNAGAFETYNGTAWGAATMVYQTAAQQSAAISSAISSERSAVASYTNKTFGAGCAWQGGMVGAAYGGTGVATLSGLAYGNGTAAFSVATGAQVVAAIGATAVQNATYATSAGSAGSATSVAWSGVTGKPTTRAGYGITDAAPNGNAGFNGITVTSATGAPTGGSDGDFWFIY